MLIIGDVMGELELLEKMLDRVKGREVYIAGDLLGRGDKNMEVLYYARYNNIKTIKGKCISMLLNYADTLKLFRGRVGDVVSRCSISKNIKLHYNKTVIKQFNRLSKEEKIEAYKYMSSMCSSMYLKDKDILILYSGIVDYRDKAFKYTFDKQKKKGAIGGEGDKNIRFNGFNTKIVRGHDRSCKISRDSVSRIRVVNNRIDICCGGLQDPKLGALEIKDNQLIGHYVTRMMYMKENIESFE